MLFSDKHALIPAREVHFWTRSVLAKGPQNSIYQKRDQKTEQTPRPDQRASNNYTMLLSCFLLFFARVDDAWSFLEWFSSYLRWIKAKSRQSLFFQILHILLQSFCLYFDYLNLHEVFDCLLIDVAICSPIRFHSAWSLIVSNVLMSWISGLSIIRIYFCLILHAPITQFGLCRPSSKWSLMTSVSITWFLKRPSPEFLAA